MKKRFDYIILALMTVIAFSEKGSLIGTDERGDANENPEVLKMCQPIPIFWIPQV